MNYNLSIDICKLHDSGLATLKGRRCIIVPLEANGLEEKNGKVFIPATMWERTDRNSGKPVPDQYGSTHYLRLNLKKEVRDAMTDEERKAIPYLGNAYPAEPRQEAARQLPVTDNDLPAGDEDMPDWLK